MRLDEGLKAETSLVVLGESCWEVIKEGKKVAYRAGAGVKGNQT